MKVVFVHQDGKLTGSAYSLLNLINGFKARVEAHVVLAEVGPYYDLLSREGISCSVYPFVRFWTFPGPNWYHLDSFSQIAALRSAPGLRQHILRLQPDLVHINDKAALQAGVSLRGCGVPIVQHLRSTYYPTQAIWSKWLSIYGIKSFADALIAISEDEKDGFSADRRLSTIFNTVNLGDTEEAISKRSAMRKSLGFSDETFSIGYAANISAQKGAWDFLEMAIQLRQRFPGIPFKFIMAGNLPQDQSNPGRLVKWGLKKWENPKAKLEAFQAHELLKGHLVITGFRQDILGLMAAMDVMVVCTRLGVLGRQPFEAMAVKTPVVVASGHSGQSRIVLHEKTGLVVPMKKTMALANAVCKIIENPVLKETLIQGGYKYAQEKFNPTVNSIEVLKIYQKLLGIIELPNTAYASA